MKTTLKKLKNGTPVLLIPKNDTNLFSLLILVKVGSRFESATNNGVSHFIEHLIFKGSKNRPNYLDISKDLDGLGAEYNAFTSKDLTGYYIKAENKKLKPALDILADIVFQPLFEKKEIEQERGVILEEMNMYEDNPMMHIENLLEESIFSGHSLGRLIIGPRKVIKKIGRAEIASYFNKYYQPSNVLIAVAGNFSQGQVLKILESKLKTPLDFARGRQNQKLKTKEKVGSFKSVQRSPRVKVFYKDTQQIHTAIGFPTFKRTDKRSPVLAILATLLGGNMSSRLFVEVREKRGLAYYIRTGLEQFSDTGVIMIQAGLEKSKVFKALEVINEQLKDLAENKVSAEELKRAKDFFSGALSVKLEDSSNLVQWLAKQQAMDGKFEALVQRQKKINQVTAGQIQSLATQIFVKKNYNLAVIGPYKNSQTFKKAVL